MNILSLCVGGDGEGEVGEGTEGGEEGLWLRHLLLHLTWKGEKSKSENKKVKIKQNKVKVKI